MCNAGDGAHGKGACNLGLIGECVADGACAVDRDVERGGCCGNQAEYGLC